MENKINWKSVIRIAGAYAAFCIGSGYATGQEILQFFTSYGYESYAVLILNLIGFIIVGPALMTAGQAPRISAVKTRSHFDEFEYFCGPVVGRIYSWIHPVFMLATMVILMSGAGAAIEEYYGLAHFVGALLMSFMIFAAYAIGFERFVKVLGFIGPVLIGFCLAIGIITLLRDWDGIYTVSDYEYIVKDKQTMPWWWLSGLLYISYNLFSGSKYYGALGATSTSRKEVVIAATIGSAALMAAILVMNTSMLINLGEVGTLDVPTLYLGRKISWFFGAAFSIVLLMGIFSPCSAMLWTVTEKFAVQGTRKSLVIAAIVSLIAFCLGLLPFADLIGKVYSVMGYAGLVLIVCAGYKRIRNIKRSVAH